MKIAFTGDIVLQNTEFKSIELMNSIDEFCKGDTIKLVINLESPICEDLNKVKSKICLYSHPEAIKHIRKINPYLINLSNNHINDYGNEGVESTINILSGSALSYYGVGLNNDKNHIHIDNSCKLINLAYTHETADQSGNELHCTDDNLGPKNINLLEIKDIRRKYPDYKIIVSCHWGDEDISIPSKCIVELAHNIVDNGADLIIGHHPHIIQPIEKYKGKYIFYSLGNFYFPEIKVETKNGFINKKPESHQTKGLIPIINIEDDIEIDSLSLVNTTNDSIEIKITDLKFFKFYEKKIILFRLLKYIREKKQLYKYYLRRIINLRA